MAAPSRSRSYRKGVALDFDLEEYFAVLGALRDLPKSANAALRSDAGVIAERIIMPIVKQEILRHAPTVAANIIASMRVGRDRVPKVIIGRNGPPYYSGKRAGHHNRRIGPQTEAAAKFRQKNSRVSSTGRSYTLANGQWLRYGSIVGTYRRHTVYGGSWHRDAQEVLWPKNVVKPGWTKAASDRYMAPVFESWQESVRDICIDWQNGRFK